MTVDEIITKIRYRLSDITDEAYDDDMLFEYINDGAKDFSYTGCCQTIENVNSGSTISTLTLSSELTYVDWLNIYSVEYASAELAFAPRFEAVRWLPAAGTPAGWSVWGDVLYIDTIVTLSASNDIDISYTYVPDDITATTDTSPLEDKWSPALVAYCIYRCRKADRESGLADNAFAEYLAIKQAAAKIYEALLIGGGFS